MEIANKISNVAQELAQSIEDRLKKGLISINDPKVKNNQNLVSILKEGVKTIYKLDNQVKKASVLNANGKLPPQAVELESAVLGALMLEKTGYTLYENAEGKRILKSDYNPAAGHKQSCAVDKIISRASAKMFYKQQHQYIFEAIEHLYNANEKIDLLTVIQTLRKKGNIDKVGGPQYIADLTSKVASSENIETHFAYIFQKYLVRELIALAETTLKKAYDESEDCFELLDEITLTLLDIRKSITT